MAERLSLTQLFITGGSFLSAVAFGYLFFTRRNRDNQQWVTDQVTELTDWVDSEGKEIYAKSIDQMQQFRKNVRLRFMRHIPDLYQATSQIDLSTSEIAKSA